MKTKRCYVRIPLKNAVINPPTLDGLLAFAEYARSQDLERAHHGLPLASTDGIYHASAPIYENFNGQAVVQFTGALRPQHVDPDYAAPNRAGKLQWGTTRVRECGNVMSAYYGNLASAIWYFFETTDPQAVQALLANIYFIGKAHNKGYGQIDGKPTFGAASVNGLVDSAGNPLRPIPVEFKGVAQDAVIADVACRPAYWDPENSQACFILTNNQFTSIQIEEEFL